MILKSDFFNGMLTLPIAGAAPPSLSQSSKSLLESAKNSGLDGTSDETAVAFPEMLDHVECEVFLEFIFNLLP